jgi:hypothetical protein
MFRHVFPSADIHNTHNALTRDRHVNGTDMHVLSRRHVWVRADLSIYMMVVEMHTWSPHWKHVLIIIILIVIIVIMHVL